MERKERRIGERVERKERGRGERERERKSEGWPILDCNDWNFDQLLLSKVKLTSQ